MRAERNNLRHGRCFVPAILIFWTPLSVSSQNRDVFRAAAPESQGLASSALKELSDVVRGFVDKGKIVGAELLVIKNRKTVLHAAVGWKDREDQVPMNKSTIFNIRSMTKPVTGTVTQMLIDDGKLSMSEPVSKYLQSFDNERSRTINVGHLLTHRSGLPLTGCIAAESLSATADCWGKRGPEAFLPGTGFTYSDAGSETLGAVLAEAAEMPLDRLVTQRIIKALGMHDSFTMNSTDGEHLQLCASRYVHKNGTWVRYWKPSDGSQYPFMRGSQGLGCTPLDYARFLAFWMDEGRAGGRQLLSKSAVERGLTPVSLAGLPTGFPDAVTYYGQMWVIYVHSGARELLAWGHSGSDGTYAWVWPQHDLMVLYFTQSRGTPTGLELEAAIDRLLITPLRR